MEKFVGFVRFPGVAAAIRGEIIYNAINWSLLNIGTKIEDIDDELIIKIVRLKKKEVEIGDSHWENEQALNTG